MHTATSVAHTVSIFLVTQQARLEHAGASSCNHASSRNGTLIVCQSSTQSQLILAALPYISHLETQCPDSVACSGR